MSYGGVESIFGNRKPPISSGQKNINAILAILLSTFYSINSMRERGKKWISQPTRYFESPDQARCSSLRLLLAQKDPMVRLVYSGVRISKALYQTIVANLANLYACPFPIGKPPSTDI